MWRLLQILTSLFSLTRLSSPRPRGAVVLLALLSWATMANAQVVSQTPEAIAGAATEAFDRGDYERAAHLYTEMVEEDPSNWQAAFRGAFSWHKAGDYERSAASHAEVARKFPQVAPTCHFNAACAFAMLGRDDQALDELALAFDKGYADIEGAKSDSDLASLYALPRFRKILEAAKLPPLTWENYEEQLEREAERGFSGAVLIVRDGRIVHERGYGFASREEKIPVTPETVFSIGSLPIDFTHIAVLKLIEEERLDRATRIDQFFPNVPPDKSAITVGHLMTGQSGLPDFHHRPKDENRDHSWIDRNEAVRRIMEQKLHFEPGTGREHSHSAWGLLAAIVEIVTEKSFQDYTRQIIFEPAGMTSTGFNGDPVPKERLAIGYSSRSNGELNAPPYWGPTSWLVLGSGGQVSTVQDLYRLQRALREGRILGKEATEAYFGPGNGDGIAPAGNMWGFYCSYSQGAEDLFILLCNSADLAVVSQVQRVKALARSIYDLIQMD